MTPELQTVDQNLQILKSIESGWGLPQFPPQVKLDLASIGFPVAGLQAFLGGIEEGYAQAAQGPPVATRSPDLVIPRSRSYGTEDPGRILYGVTGRGSPFKLDQDAVSTWKQRAVEQGYLELSEQEQADPRWLPEYSYVAAEMAADVRSRQFSGEVPGSFSIPQIMDAVGDWLTPAGLYSAATALDLWWDPEAIGSEAASWGQKWQDWTEQWYNPAKLLDAISGPIDDIVFPVLNWALMMTGIGEVYATGRVMYGVAKNTPKGLIAANTAIKNVQGLYSGMKSVRVADKYLDAVHGAWVPGAGGMADRLTDIRNLKTKSLLAGGLSGSGGIKRLGTAGQKTGEMMDAWRRQNFVTLAKKTNQQVIRMGITSRAQDFVNASEGNFGAIGGFEEWVRTSMGDPRIDIPIDLMLTPWNFFETGAMKALYRASGYGTMLSPVVTPATKVIKPSVHKMFAPLADSDRMLQTLHGPTQRHLAKMPDGGKGLEQYEREVNTFGLKKALANNWTGGNVDALGDLLAFTIVSGVIDATARGASKAGTEVEELMSHATRAAYHQSRNILVEQLRIVEATDLDSIFRTISRSGDPKSIAAGDFSWDLVRPGKLETKPATMLASQRDVRESFLETAEAATARAGAVPEGHQRLYRYRTGEGPDGVRWTDNPADPRLPSDPVFTDVHADEFADWADRAGTVSKLDGDDVVLPPQFARRYGENRLSQAAGVRVYDQDKLVSLRGLVDGHNRNRNELFASMFKNGMLSEGGSGGFDALSLYMDDILPTFGKWADYFANYDQVARMLANGQLDDAAMKVAISEGGRQLSFHKGSKEFSQNMTQMFIEGVADGNLGDRLRKSIFSPFVREIDPSLGRFGLARRDTKVKQDYLHLAHQVDSRVQNIKAFRKLKGMRKWGQIVEEINKVDPESTTPALFAQAMGEQISEMTTKQQERLAKILDRAWADNIPIDDLERHMDDELWHLLRDPSWSEEFNVPTMILMEEEWDIVAQAMKQRKELMGQSNFVAMEVEVPAEMAEYFAKSEYKVVYGTEFITPNDVLDVVPELGDVTSAQIRSSKLQRFFERPSNDYMRARKSQIQRSELTAALYRAKDEEFKKFKRGEKLGPDDTINLVVTKDPTKDSADMDRLMSDLWDILDERGHHIITQKDLVLEEGATLTQRGALNFQSSRIPQGIEQLPTAMTQRQLEHSLQQLGYTRAERKAIIEGLYRSKKMSYEDYGLFNIEMHLRSRPQLVDGLRLLGKHEAADKFKKGSGAARAAVWGGRTEAAIGTVTGAALAAQQYDEDNPALETNWGSLGRNAALLAGGIGGKMVGSAVAKRGLPFSGGKGALVQNATGKGKFNQWAGELEHSKHMKWAYLADNLVDLRDRARFTLSPIFDASRYSEAAIMSQAADLPEGIALKLDQSPRAFRKMRAKQMAGDGPVTDSTRKAALAEWKSLEAEFHTISKREFDWNAIDATARRFSSVGILGFSPTHWMTSTYGHLMNNADFLAGFASRQLASKKAYEVVRNIHTYGTQARSAAELSTNFVFFPFSFTKKVAGHMGKYLTNDMSRLVVMHDSLKMYETLSEHYDLGEKWKAHLPILEKMRRLNVLAYGIGLGRFGGVNASIVEAASALPGIGSAIKGPSEIAQLFGPAGAPDLDVDAITNLFIPQLVNVEGSGADDAWDLVQRAFPFINDAATLADALFEQGRVIASESHMTRFAEQQRGWDQWRAFQDTYLPALEAQGISWDRAMQIPEFNQLVQWERAEIARENPSWIQQMGDGISNQVALDMEKKVRIADWEAKAPTSAPGDFQLARFEALLQAARDAGFNPEERPEEIPPAMYTKLRKIAIGLAQEEPDFVRLYNRFYRRVLGDITTEMY